MQISESTAQRLRIKVARYAQFDGIDFDSFLAFLEGIHAFELWEEEELDFRPIFMDELEEIYNEQYGGMK